MKKVRVFWENLQRWQVMAAVVIGIVILDLGTKFAVVKNIDMYTTAWEAFGGALRFTYLTNDGAAWSMFAGQTWFLIVTSLALLILMFGMIRSYKDNTKVVYSLTAAIGGAVGNLYERVFNNGKVTDFIDFNIAGYDFPVFNIADMFIVGGMIAAVVFAFVAERKGKKNGN